jgi:hypothetical protein
MSNQISLKILAGIALAGCFTQPFIEGFEGNGTTAVVDSACQRYEDAGHAQDQKYPDSTVPATEAGPLVDAAQESDSVADQSLPTPDITSDLMPPPINGSGDTGAPAGACGSVSDAGCCVGNVLYYCHQGKLNQGDCSPNNCGWSASNEWYDCTKGKAISDPSGAHPRACASPLP